MTSMFFFFFRFCFFFLFLLVKETKSWVGMDRVCFRSGSAGDNGVSLGGKFRLKASLERGDDS